MNKINKIAGVTISISWVLMLIVGVFFISISYKIVTKYQANEELKTNIEFKSSLQNIFNKLGRTTGIEKESIHSLEKLFSGRKIETVCAPNKDVLLSIDGDLDKNNQYLNIYPTFINKIDVKKSDETYLLVENFKMPFKITNMMAITSKRNLIIFDKESEIGIKLNNKFQKGSYSELYFRLEETKENSNIKKIKEKYIKDRNINTLTIVTDKINKVGDLTDINIPTNIIEVKEYPSKKTGTITFYDKEKTAQKEEPYKYYDSDKSYSIITMAIFSNKESFSCSYNKINNAINETYNFYIKKTEEFLKTARKGDEFCSLNSKNKDYSDIITAYKKLNKSLSDITKEKEPLEIDSLSAKVSQIDTNNYNLERELNCPYIY